MAKIYRAPEVVPLNITIPKIFLAGSIDMGKAVEWQTAMEKVLSPNDVAIFNPRRLDFDSKAEYSEDSPYMVEQVEWELNQLHQSDIVLFYFDPKGQAPITLYELGLVSDFVKAGFVQGIVLCPKGYWKRANVIINARFHNFKIVDSFKQLYLETENAIRIQNKRPKNF